MRRLGITLVETLVVTAIVGVVLAGAAQGLTAVMSIQNESVEVPAVHERSTEIVWKVGNSIRRASLCTASVGCVTNSAVSDTPMPSANSVTLYTSAAGDTIRWFQGTTSGNPNVSYSINGGTATVFRENATLALTYYTSLTHWSSSWTTVASPDATDLLKVIAVKVNATVTENGTTSEYSTLVRLRNSPKR